MTDKFLVVSNDIHKLLGVGEEILLDHNGEPIAKFIDGNIACEPIVSGNREEITLLVAS